MVSNWDTVQVRSQVKQSLTAIYENDKKRPDNQRFNAWFDNLLQKYVEYNQDLRIYGPFLEYKGAEQNKIEIYDHQKQSTFHVFLDGTAKKLHCEQDNSEHCLHVGFCFATPDVYKVLIENGFKEPKVKK